MQFGGMGKAIPWEDIKPIPEDTVITENEKFLKNTQFLGFVTQLLEIQSDFTKTVKPLEGVESFNKVMNEIEINATRALQHTLTTLSNEVNFGKSVIDDSREKLDEFRRSQRGIQSNSNQTFPSAFFTKYVEDIDKKAEEITDAIKLYERSLEPPKYSTNPTTLIQMIEFQHDAIIRCASKMADIKDKTNKLLERVSDRYKNNGLKTDILDSKEAETEKMSDAIHIEAAYKQYLNKRKADLEKRDKKTNFEELCKGTATNTFGSGLGGGLGKGIGGGTTSTSTSTGTTSLSLKK
ncbi:hypothetical protein TVAG_001520 [Trichomonas vaginalis G3]|uniref:Uncharacterized protein n=1 Tax=Trichomonas vaginalis (strain ATCC PRA-98 / G3) TaxID=412133 RepID=A2FLI5_TRIV3|nr:hypothetical protein TVAGG3_0616640 [Trichomonas vaginalis G3]EAX94235.1 hypothetical protein TVAG_001520 [Trichomonas vaginalis G3]KAI5503594.1 hypothetical protein TVAGG3_0616640 [Trichomonas vaginalis G3]|eukprot:XP_001307165.1 hypothetical protein [Trichomonas vaginalis G3]